MVHPRQSVMRRTRKVVLSLYQLGAAQLPRRPPRPRSPSSPPPSLQILSNSVPSICSSTSKTSPKQGKKGERLTRSLPPRNPAPVSHDGNDAVVLRRGAE